MDSDGDGNNNGESNRQDAKNAKSCNGNNRQRSAVSRNGNGYNNGHGI